MASSPVEPNAREDTSDARPEPLPIRGGPACDACRVRKIRCDRQSPCAHCSRTGIECTLAAVKPKEKRTRILLTPQYERKFDHLDRRLDGVVKLLDELKHSINAQNPPSGVKPTPLGDVTSHTSGLPHNSGESKDHLDLSSGSDSTLAVHSQDASDFIHKVITTTPPTSFDEELARSIDALGNVVNTMKPSILPSESSFPRAKPLRTYLTSYHLPPFEKVVGLINGPNCQRSMKSILIFSLFPTGSFTSLCLRVYFSKDYSEIDFVAVNVGLYYLLHACAFRALEPTKHDYLRFADMCRDNVETSLSILPLYLPPTPGTIVGLLCGVYFALNISQPHLSWTLLAKASELCQSLRWHHQSKAQAENTSAADLSHRQLLFWYTYAADKTLTLRLGRASTIPDWNITVSLPDPQLSDSPFDPELGLFLLLGVKAARCHGTIYELLYSSASLAQPDHIRQAHVQALDSQLEEFGSEIELYSQKCDRARQSAAVEQEDEEEEESIRMAIVSQEIVHLSLLTLVHRAANRSATPCATFNARCMTNARASMERMMHYMSLLQRATSCSSPFMHNILLYAPIPFVTMVCSVIETLNQADLARLRDFNIVLDDTSARISGAVAKMLRLFSALYDVVARYVELRTGGSSNLEKAIDANHAELDYYLSLLGAAPNTPCSNEPQQELGKDRSLILGTGIASRENAAGIDGGDNRHYQNMNPLMWIDNVTQEDDWFFECT